MAALIVEKDPTHREELHRAFIDAGVVTIAVANAEDAIQTVRDDPRGYSSVHIGLMPSPNVRASQLSEQILEIFRAANVLGIPVSRETGAPVDVGKTAAEAAWLDKRAF